MIGRFVKRKPAAAAPGPIVVNAGKMSGGDRTKTRIGMTIAIFLGIYAVIGGRLVYLGIQDPMTTATPGGRVLAARPDIVDRNGEVLATDIKTASLYAEPRNIVDADEALELLSTVLPDLDPESTFNKLKSGTGFVWLRRQLTPAQQADIMALGLPGIGFRTEIKRFYPGGPTASHILGLVNIDNQGIAGLERWIDNQGLADLRATGLATATNLAPVKTTLDLRVQHIVRDELATAMEKYHAIAAGAVVLNAKTGEIVAMASLPDFDPNTAAGAHDKDRFNRMTAGTFEMGSTIKSFTTAMALDSGKVTMASKFDATRPITIGRQTIRDFHGKGRVLTVPEVFIYSSNIGSAREADVVGIEGHREFLKRMGLLDKMKIQLPEVRTPTEPKVWKKVHSITISFGHGMTTTPLQTAVAAAALMNGGLLFDPTLLPRNADELNADEHRVIKEKTSEDMRYLYRLNAEKGSGKRAEVPGYRVGGKTGTAEKVVNGRYSKDKRFNAFLAAFPMDDPQYIVLSIIDEPKPEKPGMGATAGLNAAPIVAGIIRRSASFLGVKPEFGHESGAMLVSYQ